MTYIQKLEEIADIAEKILNDAYPLQEQFNPETYEVQAKLIIRLSKALHELAELNITHLPAHGEGLGASEQ